MDHAPQHAGPNIALSGYLAWLGKKKGKNSLTICMLLHSGWLVYSFISLLTRRTNSTVKITVKKLRGKADCRRRTLSPFHTHYDKTYSWKLFTLVTKQCLKKRNKIAWIIRTGSVLSLGLGFPKLFGLPQTVWAPSPLLLSPVNQCWVTS